jgi:hypothetical protein
VCRLRLKNYIRNLLAEKQHGQIKTIYLKMKAGFLEFRLLDSFCDSAIWFSKNLFRNNIYILCSFNICGRVTISKFPDSLSQQVTKRKLIIFPEGKGSAAVSKETDDEGKFCTPVKPGKYIVRVSII